MNGHYFELMIEDRVEAARTAMDENPDINLENVRLTGEMLFSPRTHATITLLGLLFTGAIYSVIIVLLMRKLPGFK